MSLSEQDKEEMGKLTKERDKVQAEMDLILPPAKPPSKVDGNGPINGTHITKEKLKRYQQLTKRKEELNSQIGNIGRK